MPCCIPIPCCITYQLPEYSHTNHVAVCVLKVTKRSFTHSSRMRMTSLLFSNTSCSVMTLGCWICFRMLTSLSMSSLDTPRLLDLLRRFLMNFAAYWYPVLFLRHFLTTANCPLEKNNRFVVKKTFVIRVHWSYALLIQHDFQQRHHHDYIYI